VPEYNADEIPKIASFLRNLGAVKKVKILPYHKMAGEKYRALGMNPSMPARVPTEREIQEAEQYFDFLPRK
jgi:pyruvate-formate lyase-activating enzyme